MKHVQVAAFSLTQGRFTRSSVCTGNTSLQRRLRFAFQQETTSVLAVLLSRIYICGMAQHGHIVVFTLAVLLLSSLFFSEWFPQSSSTTSYSQRLLLSDSQFKHQRQDIQRLLLTPTFTTHLIWIVGLLSLFALFNLVLKLVSVACTLGDNSITPPRCYPAEFPR